MKTTVFLFSMFTAIGALAHPGGLDANGGHHDRKNGGYHYHRSPATTPPASEPVHLRPTQITQPPVQTQPTPAPAPIAPFSDAQKQDIELKTVEWQKKQAEAGSTDAQYELGKRYFTGQGVPKDLDKAASLFERAAKQGHPGAPSKLAEVLKEKERLSPRPSNENSPNEVERLRQENQELRRLLAGSQATNAATREVAPRQSETRQPTAGATSWSLSSTGKRHNNTCRYFSVGKPCGAAEGVPCKICGG